MRGCDYCLVGFVGNMDCVTISSISSCRLSPGMLKIDEAEILNHKMSKGKR